MRVLLLHPGAGWSTADVESGLRYGLEQHGVDVIRYRLDRRLGMTKFAMNMAWRQAKKHRPDLPKPTHGEVMYEAAWPVIEPAVRLGVDAIIIVSGMFVPLDAVKWLKKAGQNVFVLFTETPYDTEQELLWAAEVDGCWTHERASLPQFRSVNPRSGYLPHGFHPLRHTPGVRESEANVPSHDVVFVGSGFPERIQWFNSIDWSGIDLGLYGSWKGLGLDRRLKQFVRSEPINNEYASALYRKSKIGLNLYRTRGMRRLPLTVVPESLSPRAYELAACGVFHLSENRAEVREVFGDLVPTFSNPREAETLIRRWLADDAGRAEIAAQLPACVAGHSWVERSTRVIGDLQLFLGQLRAA